ncbi:MAG: Fe-S cluster domain-containing protein [Bacteroidales bacterium]|nr:Fe-S cluster domain-containing protein [Bacteroidales bacterium]MBN2761524.1 Fe-S cluster domain-containing protein [Bacteroidales bacterium]
MTSTILYPVIALSALGLLAAVVLYLVAQRFRVFEDPRIDEVEEALPGANCGGCGYAGCRNFAEALVNSESFEGLYCPVGGNETMEAVARILGRESTAKEPQVAVLRCNGSCEYRPKINQYDGVSSCAVASALYGGDTGCQYGCLGLGDCVEVCTFDALHMDPVTGLPVVDDDKCTACGACVKACPRNLFELRKRWKGNKKIYVACMNEDKGGIARKNCSVACIGCAKCFKVCPYEAITMNNNLAFIDSYKCKLCRKCVLECPTASILEIGFPPRKEKTSEGVGEARIEKEKTKGTDA